MWSADENISQAGKGVFHKIPGYALDKNTGKNTGNLNTFFPSSFNRKYVHTVTCTVVFVGFTRFVWNAYYPGRNATCPPFPAVLTKTMHAVALTDFYRSM